MAEVKKRTNLIRFLQTEYPPGHKAPASAIYECSECGSITAFQHGDPMHPCEDCDAPSPEQTWYRTNEFVHFVSKNLNTEFERVETFSIRLAEFISDIAGNIWFVYSHIAWFAFWMYVNTGHELFGVTMFDPYPFGFLTMVVSLEAIFLSLFIMISQNIQSKRSELRAELDYQTNIKAEKGVAEVLSILHDLHENGVVLSKSAHEVLNHAGIHQSTPKRKSAKPKHSRPTRKILKDAGIDTVHHG